MIKKNLIFKTNGKIIKISENQIFQLKYDDPLFVILYEIAILNTTAKYLVFSWEPNQKCQLVVFQCVYITFGNICIILLLCCVLIFNAMCFFCLPGAFLIQGHANTEWCFSTKPGASSLLENIWCVAFSRKKFSRKKCLVPVQNVNRQHNVTHT